MKNIFCTILLLGAITLSNISQAQEIQPVIINAKCMRPNYPSRSLKNQETGTVTFSLLIDIDGSVVDSKIDVSSGFRLLDRATLVSARECKFVAGTKDGHPEKMWVTQQFIWNLPSDINDLPLSR